MAEEKVYSLEEVKKHTTSKDCWFVVHGKVYDVTNFVEDHPGGYDAIICNTGKDATANFDEVGHSVSAKKFLQTMCIGKFEGGDSAPAVVEEKKPVAPIPAKKSCCSGCPASCCSIVSLTVAAAIVAGLVYFVKAKQSAK
uniref:Cytochrome b5 heme-binding domain-containing protein n=1 Tax=Polytomella parva TaxID=51329 RepID=A0A7S0ULC0_9CHLO|mmetsp:Transcript_136/g.159  ORF Transcript_136/g.159 Transcript_136/m.159 type:complete len:140 (+) Transcript_136:85-504(+)